MAKKEIYIGASFSDTLGLRTKNPNITNLYNPFVIEVGSVVEVLFPNGVILSTANIGEVTIDDANLSTISYLGSPAQSLTFTAADNLAIDVRVTQGISGKVEFFESLKALDIIAPAN